MAVHFLHVGKTGGSALKAAILPLGRSDLVLHDHAFTLADVPAGDVVVVAIRHPIDRFVSGFYSRMRRGRPLYDVPWSPEESAAFHAFGSANALAEGLAETDAGRRAVARGAMAAIGHTRTFLSDWLGAPHDLRAGAERILAILHQPDLDADFEDLKIRLAIPQARLPREALGRHANGPEFDTRLSDKAKAALAAWYAADVELYAAALALRSTLRARTAEAA